MDAFAALPLPLRFCLVGLAGAIAGGLANWAIYRFAWNKRPISPWSASPAKAPPRRWLDHVPIVGWFGLRRESPLHGNGHWIRPLLIEVLLAAGWMLLYWWEVETYALHLPQLTFYVGEIVAGTAKFAADDLHWMFCGHALLILLMTVASFIDIDDWIIPDAVTVVGTILGLLLATLAPVMLLPRIGAHVVPPLGSEAVTTAAGVPLDHNATTLFTMPLTTAVPHDWPRQLAGAPNLWSLALALGCFWTWCFALTPRIWRGRRGPRLAMRLIALRVWRELRRPIMIGIETIGTVGIVFVWRCGGVHWMALLTALIGLMAGGGIVWAVRLIGKAALKREAMGFGDVTLMMMIGTYVGWQTSLFIFFLAPVAGIVVGVLRLLLFKDREIPYGPFLCLATLFVIVRWGDVWTQLQAMFDIPWLVPLAMAICAPLMFLLLLIMRLIFPRNDEEG